MTAATISAPTYTDREQAIADCVIVELRAHIGRRLAKAVEPCAEFVDGRWVERFARIYGDRHAVVAHGDTDYVTHRAISAAHDVREYTVRDFPEFYDNRERAISREGKQLVFADVAMSLQTLSEHTGGADLPKATVLAVADELSRAREMPTLRARVLGCADRVRG